MYEIYVCPLLYNSPFKNIFIKLSKNILSYYYTKNLPSTDYEISKLIVLYHEVFGFYLILYTNPFMPCMYALE